MGRKKTQRSYRNIRITPKGYAILKAMDEGRYRPKTAPGPFKRDASGRFAR